MCVGDGQGVCHRMGSCLGGEKGVCRWCQRCVSQHGWL